MPELAIRARFPLGRYQGHRDVGRACPFPETARLFSALVHAAGTGSPAAESNGRLGVSEESAEALRWLESHSPSMLRLPAQRSRPDGTVSWRVEGVLEGSKSPQDRKVAKVLNPGVPIEDYVGWAWDEDVPAHVVRQLDLLCAEVSCLGEADSPVVLEVIDIEPTHRRDARQGGFPRPGGVRVSTPLTGRLDELEAEHQLRYPKKRPSTAQDRSSWGQEPFAPLPPTERTGLITYRDVEPTLPDLPWDVAWALIPDRSVGTNERVEWCVALHRALVSRLGDDAPAVVTGHYAPGASKPANGLAVQYVAGPTVDERLRGGAFLVMAPQGADPGDLAAVERAVRQVQRVYRGSMGDLSLTKVDVLDLESFWMPPLPGMKRVWSPTPACVPEIRRPKGASGWRLADAALVAVGHVYRDRLQLKRERGEARYRAIAEQVRDWGVRVSDVHPVGDSRVERFAHRLPQHLTAQPFTARIDLAGLLPDTALVAIGQSRHLGGGLLLPQDVPDERGELS